MEVIRASSREEGLKELEGFNLGRGTEDTLQPSLPGRIHLISGLPYSDVKLLKIRTTLLELNYDV